MPSAGDLRDSIRVDRRADTGPDGDGAGNFEGEWITIIDRRSCKLTPTRGGEQIIAGRSQGVMGYDLWLRLPDRAVSGIVPGDRVVDRRDPTRVFNIKTPMMDMDGRRTWALFQVELGVADG